MQVNHGVMIDRAEPVLGYKTDVVAAFRFNAYFWSESAGVIINDLYTRGFRVHDGIIKAPSYVGNKGGTWPNLFLPRVWASELADLLLGNEELKKQFPTLYPLLPKETLISNLEFPVTLYKRDFPELGRIRGFLGPLQAS